MMGLLYRYVKVILNNLKPKSQEPGEIVRMLRNINQQSHAFTREMQENLIKNKKELSKYIPSMKTNFLEERMKIINNEVKLAEKEIISSKESKLGIQKDIKVNGVSLFEQCILERREIINKKKKTESDKVKLF